MDRVNSGSNFTVQGVGSPVPASDRGEQAGSGTSIYNDCKKNKNPSLGVASLALNECTATSKRNDDALDPFKRRSKVQRTPPSGKKDGQGETSESSPTVDITERREERSNTTLQGVESPVMSSVSGEHVAPGTSVVIQQRQNEKENVNPSLGVAHLASKECTITSKSVDEELHLSKTMETEEDIILQEISKCMDVLKTMKLACAKQKNVSKDIKAGMEMIEESLDKMKWQRKRQKDAHPAKTVDERPKQRSQDAATQTYEDETRQVSISAKRPPSSPLAKRQDKRTRKSPIGVRRRIVPEGEDPEKQKSSTSEAQESLTKTPTNTEERNYAQAAKQAETVQHKQPPGKDAPESETHKKRKKKDKSKRRRRQKPEAILIKPNEGGSFSDILREIRQKVNPEDSETIVKTVRKTKAGDVLLEFAPKAKNRPIFEKSIQDILGDKAQIRNLEPKTTLEIRDLDELTTEEEVQKAIEKQMGDQPVDLKIFITKVNRSALKMAIVNISERAASEILRKPVLRIGWSQCRIRRRIEVLKCFRCLDYGHLQTNCNGPDRRKQGMCFNCGNTDHKRKECKEAPKCYLCASLENQPCLMEHIPGSGKCRAFKLALEKAKKASSK